MLYVVDNQQVDEVRVVLFFSIIKGVWTTASRFCLNLSRSRASRRCERECRTKAHHGRKLNGMTIALISAKGGSRSERAQVQTAQAKTSCGEPTPSQRPRVRRPHGSQPPAMRQPLRDTSSLRVLLQCPPMRQPLTNTSFLS